MHIFATCILMKNYMQLIFTICVLLDVSFSALSLISFFFFSFAVMITHHEQSLPLFCVFLLPCQTLTAYFRFEKFWKQELEKYGKEKASVTRTIIRMIRRRLLIAALLTILFAVLSILGQVRTTLVSPHLVSVLF